MARGLLLAPRQFFCGSSTRREPVHQQPRRPVRHYLPAPPYVRCAVHPKLRPLLFDHCPSARERAVLRRTQMPRVSTASSGFCPLVGSGHGPMQSALACEQMVCEAARASPVMLNRRVVVIRVALPRCRLRQGGSHRSERMRVAVSGHSPRCVAEAWPRSFS